MNAFFWNFIGLWKRWSNYIFNMKRFIKNVLRSTLSYPNETSKEYIQFLNTTTKYTLEKNEGTIKNWQSRHWWHWPHKTNKTQKHNTTQKIKKISNTDPTKTRGWTQVLAKDKQFLSLIRHQPCYLYWTPLCTNKHK